MNKPHEAHLDMAIELLPITSIRPSDTEIQTLRRGRFNSEALLELAASIGQVGVLEPILVRPVPIKGHVKFEIIAGERRWIAADRAGLGTVPAIVRDGVTTAQVITIQLTENKQRDDYTPLEEAAGYKALMDLEGLTAEQVGEKIGLSRAYVYARRKLLDLCPAARDALQRGDIDASRALLIARIPGEKLQLQALKIVTETNWRGVPISYQEAFAKLREGLLTPLAGAPFPPNEQFWRFEKIAGKRGLEDAIEIPICLTCPSNSANDPELLAQAGGAQICTDRSCYDIKVIAFHRRQRDDAKKDGREILSGDAAKAIRPGQYDGGVKAGYLDLDAECEEVEATVSEPKPTRRDGESKEDFDIRIAEWENRNDDAPKPTYRQVLGADAPYGQLVEAGKGRLVELVPLKDAVKALKAKGVTLPKWKRDRSPADPDQLAHAAEEQAESLAERQAEQAREEERRNVETEYRARLFKQIVAKWKGGLKRPDLERMLEHLMDGYATPDVFEEAFPTKGGGLDKLTEGELTKRIALFLAAEDCESTHAKPGRLLDLAQRFKIDAKALRAQVVKELKPTSAPADEDGEPKKKSKKK